MSSTSWPAPDPRLVAVAVSLLLSWYTIGLPQIPNDDAYTYVRTAEIFLQQGLAAAVAHYPWPAYSVLIALLSLTGLSPFVSALVINAMGYALLVYAFVSIVQELDASRRTVWLAALTVLAFPELNEYRYLIIRDAVFWGLAMLGLWQFLRYLRDRRYLHGLLFCLALAAAVPFRIEALCYLALTPLCLLFDRRRDPGKNRQDLGQIGGTILLLGGAGWWLLLATGVDAADLTIEFVGTYQPLLRNTVSPSVAEMAARGDAIFGNYASVYSRQYVTAVLAVGLLVVLFMTVFYAISGPYFWLLVWGGLHRQWRRNSRQLLPIIAFLLINAAILLLFLYSTRYLSSRYAMVLALMAAIQVPFVVQGLIEHYRATRWQQQVVRVLALFFLFCLIDAYVSFGKPKGWLMETAQFINQHADPGTDVITNNHTIAYFSGRVEDYDRVPRTLGPQELLQATPGDLIAIELFHEMSVLVAMPELTPYLQQLAAFPAPDAPRTVVYRRVNPPPRDSGGQRFD